MNSAECSSTHQDAPVSHSNPSCLHLCRSALSTGGMLSSAAVTTTVSRNLEPQTNADFKLPAVAVPSIDDAATHARFTIIDGTADGNSGGLETLHDGLLPANSDDPDNNFFFAQGTDGGRICVDLQNALEIKEVNTYSWHKSTRAAQVYKLYISDGTGENFQVGPKKGIDPATCGWKLIAAVDTRPRDGSAGGQYGVSISETSGSLGRARYLLFDISATEFTDVFGNTFYSEIDVLDKNELLHPLIPGGARRRTGFSSTSMKYRR